MKGERKYKILESQKSNEPKWTDKPATQSELSLAFNWYNVNKNNEAAAKYLGVSNPKLVAGYQTLAWSKRMVSRGCIMPEKEAATARRMEEEFKALVKKHEKPVQTDKKVVNIQELISAKADGFIAELEGMVDDYGIKGKAKDFDAYKWMQDNGVKPSHVSTIVEHFKKQAIEPVAAAEGKDAELVEAYSTYSKARLMNLLACYAKIVSDASKLNQNTKVARKPRKKKPVSVTKKVSKLNYMKQEPKLKLQSVEPTKIVGASQLWVYNVKTRKLGIYMSSAADGLDIKGSTIVGYGEASSIAKTLRKPEKVLTEVLSGGKITLRKVMDGINSKPAALNGRINKDTILLRVV
jgi:hypothetical protein